MSNEITTLASAINTEHRKAQECAQAAIDHAYEAGRLLVEAKATVPHGDWGAWLAANFEGSDRTARGYMRLANNWEAIAAKRQSSADLSIDGALQLLSAPKDAPPEPEAKTSCWRSREPAKNAEQITLWPDLLDAPTRLYMAMGETVEDVAAIMGVDVALVKKRLYPKAQPRWHDGDWLGRWELETYRDTVEKLIDFHQWQAYLSAAYLARLEAPELIDKMEAKAEVYRERCEAGPPRLTELMLEIAGNADPKHRVVIVGNGLQMDVAAAKDYRIAVGLEPADEEPDLWIFINKSLRLDDAWKLVEKWDAEPLANP